MPIRKTLEEFILEVNKIHNGEYIVLGKEYINNKTPILMKHLICGEEYMATPHDILAGCKCKKCKYEKLSKNMTKSDKGIKQKIFDLVKNEYSMLEEYKGINNKIMMRHNICNFEYLVTPSDFINNGNRCPNCFGTHLKTQEQFEKEVYEQVGNEYTVLGNYTGTKNKIMMKHNICNFEYLVTPNKFLSLKRRCPICNESKGEKAIAKFLEDKAEFERQYTFPDCKYENLLKFDFKLEDVDEEGNLNKIILIEFDGIQHYEPTFGEEAFKLQQIRDKIKNEYCASHDNIDLYRIPYWDINNIPKIMQEIIDKYNNS